MTGSEKSGLKTFILLSNIIFFPFYGHTVYGQDLDGIYTRYKNEQAVITNIKEQLVIKNEKGHLVAKSNISKEEMLIGELSPGIYNKEYIFHSYFNQLEDYNAEALILGKNGYKKLNSVSSKTIPSEDNNVFYDDSKQTEVSFSGLTPKSLLRTNYTISHTDLHMLPAFYFQENLPIVQSTYEVTAPKYVNMKFVIKGSHADMIKQSKEENKNTVTYTFISNNVPAFKDYGDVPSTAWYALHVVPYISSYELPGQELSEMLSDPAHLYSYFYNFIRSINIKGDDEINRMVATITSGDKTQKEKAAHIYQWVQQNMHYIAFEDSLEGFIPRQASDIYKRKFGDCKDMASILTAMCRAAGIDAYFTWIGTRSKPYTYEETPLPMVANHMICTIKIGVEWIFLDGTHPLIPFGSVPAGIQGKEAMVAIDDKQFKIILVPETDGQYNVTTDSTFLNINGNQAYGKTSICFHGYPSWEMQTLMMYNRNEDRDKIVRDINSRGSNKYIQKNYQYTQSDTGYKSCRLTADFTIDDYVQKVGKDYFVNMNARRYFEGNNIDTIGRDIPVYFKYKDIEQEVVILQIPTDYHVSYLPPEDSGYLKDEWEYKIRYNVEGKTVTLLKEYKMLSMSILSKNFISHNKMIDHLQKQYKESVVLTAD